MRFAVIGAGVIGALHAETIVHVRGAELTAVVDVHPERARSLAGRYGALGLTSLEEALGRPDVEAVAICTRNVLGNANYFIITSIMQTIGVFAAALAVPRFVRTLGKKNSYLLGGVVAIVGAIGLFLAPPSIPVVAFLCFLVLGVGLGLVNTLMWAFEADTVEYGEWTSGVRTEGITYAAFSFTRKMGQAIGGAAAAYTLGFGGYVAGVHVHQTSSALFSIRLAAGVVPAAFIIIAIAIMAFYPLTETRFREIVREMAERRATRAATTATPAPAPQ